MLSVNFYSGIARDYSEVSGKVYQEFQSASDQDRYLEIKTMVSTRSVKQIRGIEMKTESLMYITMWRCKDNIIKI